MNAMLRYNLGEVVFAQGRFDEAETLLLESRRLFAAALGERHPLTGPPTLYLAKIAARRGDVVDAERLFLEVLERYRQAETVDPELVEQAEEAYARFRRQAPAVAPSPG